LILARQQLLETMTSFLDLHDNLDQIFWYCTKRDHINLACCSSDFHQMTKPFLWKFVVVPSWCLYDKDFEQVHRRKLESLRYTNTLAIEGDLSKIEQCEDSFSLVQYKMDNYMKILESCDSDTLCTFVRQGHGVLPSIRDTTFLTNTFRKLRSIKRVAIVGLLGHSFDGIESLKNVVHMNLGNSSLGNAQMEAICKNLIQLKFLNIEGTSVKSDALKELENLKNLQTLVLAKCPLITDDGAAHIARCKGLTGLDISGCHITDYGMEHSISSLIDLTYLNISGMRHEMSDEYGRFYAYNLTDEGIGHLARSLRYLQRLDMSNKGFSYYGVKELENLRLLSQLTIQHATFNDDCMKSLGRIQSLTYLDIYECRGMKDSSFRFLVGLTNLQTLKFKGHFTPESVLSHIGQIISLEELVFDSPVKDADLGQLINLNKLKDLNFYIRARVVIEAFGSVSQIHSLQRLNVTSMKMSSNGFKNLSALPNLKWLICVDTDLSDQGMCHIKDMRSLKLLDVSKNNKLTAVCVYFFVFLNNLQKLICFDTSPGLNEALSDTISTSVKWRHVKVFQTEYEARESFKHHQSNYPYYHKPVNTWPPVQ